MKKRKPKRPAGRERWRRILPVALLVVAILMLCSQIKAPANLYDEGLVLVNAERIAHGETPYRDFWTIYAPGYFYALAALFSVFTPTVLAARLFDTVLRVLLVLEVFSVTSTTTSRRAALIPAALVTFWLAAIRSYLYPAFPAAAAILLAALALTRYLKVSQARWLFLTGTAVGLTALLRLDYGGYAAAGFGLAVGLHQMRLAKDGGLPWTSRLAPLAKAELAMAVGALSVALPVYAALAAAAGHETVWNDLVVFPATVFREVRHLPVPSLLPDFGWIKGPKWEAWLQLYLPLVTYGAALVVALRWLRQAPAAEQDRRRQIAVVVLAVTGTGLGMVVQATSRYDAVHVLPTTVCAAIVATTLVHWLPRRLWRSASFRVAFAGVAVLVLARPYVAHFVGLLAGGAMPPLGCYSSLPRAACVSVGREREATAEYVRARTSVGDYVFVGNKRHDLIFVNDLLLQFLINRPSPTRHAELHPGLATTLTVQRLIAQDLVEKNVRWVVLMKEFDEPEPNASSVSSGVTYLDDFILQNYRLETAIGNYRVLVRKLL